MTYPKPASYAHLTFNSPIAPWRAERLVTWLSDRRPSLITDFGCGWGELLLRLAEASPQSRGLGLDMDAELLDRGRHSAEQRGLSSRVEFVAHDASRWDKPTDLALCIGASHIWGDVASALKALFPLIRPGGHLLFGEMIWEHEPTADELQRMWEGADREELLNLAELTQASVQAGFRPLRIESVERGEMDDFESGFLADWEEFLVHHPDAPDVAHYRALANAHRTTWLEGYRNLTGFAYLTLGRPAIR